MHLLKIKKIDWSFWRHWLKCTIKDIPSMIWYVLRFRYIALIAVGVSLYILFYKSPYGDSLSWFIVGTIVLFLGLGFDMKNNTTGLY